jgi:hypothetical protein
MLWLTVGRPVCLGVRYRSGTHAQILSLSDSCRFVGVGHPLQREVGSVVYCWASLVQSFSGLSPGGLMIIFYCLNCLRLPQHEGPDPCVYIPQGQDSLVIPPGTWIPFCMPLRTCRAMVEVFNPLPPLTNLKLKSRYDWQPVSQYVLVLRPLWDRQHWYTVKKKYRNNRLLFSFASFWNRF